MNREETINIGTRLKKERLKQGLSFEEAHSDLKIHPNVLRELEEGEISDSLGDIYIKGFIRKYADYLGLQPDKVLGDHSEDSVTNGAPDDSFLLDIEKNKKLAPIAQKNRFEDTVLPIITLVTVIVAAFLAVYAGYKFIERFRRPPSPPAKQSTSAAKPAKPKPKAAKARPAAAKPAAQKPAQKPLLVPKGTPLTLKAVTRDKVWLSVTSDGKVIFQNTLAKGATRQWRADKELELWVGRGDALDLTLNDKHLGSPGVGRIRRVTINHEGMSIKKK
jgi:cytoskeletal protein RodZ